MHIAYDKEGFLEDLDDWSESVARNIAAKEGIELTDAHWQVVHALRAYYVRTQVSPAMRPFVKMVKREVAEELGNSQALLHLFPGSPAKLAAKIAGLPRPANCL